MHNHFTTLKQVCRKSVPILLTAGSIFAQDITLSGYVRNMTGLPIEGAEVTVQSLGESRLTDADGYYDFSQAVGIEYPAAAAIGLKVAGSLLLLDLKNPGNISAGIYNMSGREASIIVDDAFLTAGQHQFSMDASQLADQMYVIRVITESGRFSRLLSLHSGMPVLSTEVGNVHGTVPLAKRLAFPDSVIVTHADHYGGLNQLNRREVDSYEGTLDFRMFESDPAWRDQCAPDLTWNFDNSEGALYFQELMAGDPEATEQEVQVEVCQSIFREPTEPRKCGSYTGNVNSTVTTGVASTGGCTLNFNVGYINSQKSKGEYGAWKEVVGVLVHEAVHTYQPYYSTEGAGGFGESMPDAVRRLTGFFSWNGCRNGDYTSPYQDGGRFWHYIETYVHPGFMYEIWQNDNGHIADRVMDITGRDIDELWSECAAL